MEGLTPPQSSAAGVTKCAVFNNLIRGTYDDAVARRERAYQRGG